MNQKERNPAIDMLRAVVMILMTLDHARDFIMGFGGVDPTDLSETTPILFFTRWITHYCAPVFVFLAGMAAYLYGQKRGGPSLSRFLFTRGIWLILLELTVIKMAWAPEIAYQFIVLQVIWAIGISMLFLSGLARLPHQAVAAVGVTMVLTHNLLDGIQAVDLGSWAPLWMLFHEQGILNPAEGHRLMVTYPIYPWIGVIALGYAMGPVMKWAKDRRQRFLKIAGMGAIAAFLALRALGIYGDPVPWALQDSPVYSLMALLNCEKYPPSLAYLLMTLGPSLLLLAYFERPFKGKWGQSLLAIGRVPLFYYVAHLYLLRIGAGIASLALFGNDAFSPPPGPAGTPLLSLGWAYAAWIAAVLLLLYPSKRFAEFKSRSQKWWVSYL